MNTELIKKYENYTTNNFLEKLLKVVGTSKGIFVEAGANDGVFQSYTYILEKEFDWEGILIEPSPTAFQLCKNNRQKSTCLNFALTDNGETEIYGDFDGHPMSSIGGLRLSRANLIKVDACSLNDIFEKFLSNVVVDLLSIDVENYEYNVLRSLNFNIYKPKFILIEIYNSTFVEVSKYLENIGYILVDNLTNFNHNDNPGWTEHNDYIFKYSK